MEPKGNNGGFGLRNTGRSNAVTNIFQHQRIILFV